MTHGWLLITSLNYLALMVASWESFFIVQYLATRGPCSLTWPYTWFILGKKQIFFTTKIQFEGFESQKYYFVLKFENLLISFLCKNDLNGVYLTFSPEMGPRSEPCMSSLLRTCSLVQRLILFLMGLSWPVWPVKSCKMFIKVAKNDFTYKIKDFDTFTKIA